MLDSPLGDGTHSVTGTEHFGITVYGYGDDTSYWYAGGSTSPTSSSTDS